MRFRASSSCQSPLSLSGKIGLTLFMGAFLAMGLFFLGLIGKTVWEGAQPLLWPQTPATILASKIEAIKDDHQIKVTFRYSWEGKTYESTIFSIPDRRFNHYDTAYQQWLKFKPGAQVQCRVNPGNPDQAVLQIGDLWIGAFIIIPIVFILVGGFGVWGAWAPPAPASPRRIDSASPKVPWLFGGIFALVGFGLLIGWSIPMWTKAAASSQWPETPCVILSSRVKTHSGKDGPTYSVAISYRYQFQGQDYLSDRFDAVGGSSSGRAGKEAVVARYPKGSQQACYVNPKKPSEALLHPGFSWSLLFGLIPLLFLGVGIAVLRVGNRPKITRSTPPEPAPVQSSLSATSSPLGRLAGTILFAVIWNGIIAIFLVDLIGDIQRGRPDWLLAAFLVPFVLVGLGSLGAVVYFLLALGNPKIRIQLENAEPIEPDSTLKLSWRMEGATRRVERLVIYLEGQEEATYRKGKSTSTDREAFFRQPLADLSGSWMDMQAGTVSLLLPRDLPPSFRSLNHRLSWNCHAWGRISHWPDVRETFAITIEPPTRLR